jgi:hypothetical protein
MKKFTKLIAAFALLVFFTVPTGMRGQTPSEVTYTFSDHYSSNTQLDGVEISFDVAINGTFAKGSGTTAPQYYTNGTAVRWYGNNTLTIVASNATMTQIELTYTQKNKDVTADEGTYDHETGTWTGSATSVTFTVASGSGHNRVSAIKVIYTPEGGTPTVATPTFSPGAGTYTGAQSVTISCETDDVTIYYTIDGSVPNNESTRYMEPITIAETTTLKAIAYDSENNASNVATAVYTITLPTVATPTFSPAAGTYTEAQSVTIACDTENASIYYTLDGTDPTTSSEEYTEAISIDETTTVKAIAVKENMSNSAVASATYTINLPYAGDDYVRISNLDYLTDGARVIIAARYDATETAYYAMSNTTTGKPTGVAFTSTTSDKGEILPSSILNSESSYYWTVNVTTDGYTFTNASNEVLGYTTGTNFATGGDNTVWTIARATSGDAAMVAEYEAFYIINRNITGRGMALNNQHNYGPYATSNNNSSSYNFYLDFFVQGVTPSIDPSITANNVEIAYDATSGEIEYTINNLPDPAGTLTASVPEGSWLTLGTVGETVPFTCTANNVFVARTATVTLTYTYGDDQSVTKNVTITQAGDPDAVDNISDITEVNHDYAVIGTVVATNSRGFIIGDGTGYVYTYLNAVPTQAVGDMVKVSGTTGTYGHILQFTGSATITEATESNYDGGPEYTVITEVPDYSQGYHISDYFQFEGTLSTTTNNGTTYYTVAVGNSLIRISYPANDQVTELTALLNKIVRVHGFFAGISVSSGDSVFTVMMESVEEVGLVPAITVEPELVEAPAVETVGTLNVTYTAIETSLGAEIFWYSDSTCTTTTEMPGWILAEINSDLNVDYVIAANDGEVRTAYMKVYGLNEEGGDVYSNLVTITQAKYIAPYAELPFEFDGGRADIANTAGLTQINLGSDYNSSPKLKFNNQDDICSTLILRFNEEPGILTFSIKGNGFSGGTFKVQTSVDGEEYNDLKTYTEFGSTGNSSFNEAFDSIPDNVRYIKWIYTEKVSGNVALGNITLGAVDHTPVITISPEMVNVEAGEVDGTLSLTYVNLEINDMTDFDVQYFDAEGQEGEEPNWIEVVVDEDNDNYVVSYVVDSNEGDARSAYFKVYAMDAEANLVYSNLVTVNQAAYVAPPVPGNWVLTSLADLAPGDVFVIVGDNGDTYAMPNDNGTSTAPAAVAVTVVDGTLSEEPAANLQWNISITDEGFIFYPNGDTTTWLYCTNTNNGVRVGTNENKVFAVSENGYLNNIATGRYIGIYNSQDWRCYTSEGGNIADQTFAFYKKVSSGTIAQTVALSAGVNWFSTYVDISLSALQGALVTALPGATLIRITAQNGSATTYNGTRWRGSLNSAAWDVSRMYTIEIQSDAELSLEGEPVDPAGHSINIAPGNNWIGFPLGTGMTVSDAFAGFAIPNDKVNAQNGKNTTYNGTRWRGTLTTLEPGHGYVFYGAGTESRPFVYPTPSKRVVGESGGKPSLDIPQMLEISKKVKSAAPQKGAFEARIKQGK